MAKASAANLDDADPPLPPLLPLLSGAEEMQVKQPHFRTTVISFV